MDIVCYSRYPMRPFYWVCLKRAILRVAGDCPSVIYVDVTIAGVAHAAVDHGVRDLHNQCC
jgi:hypothetical protein